MKYRELADTGIRVSEIGFGAWGIGGASAGATSYGFTEDSVSRDALAAALDAGINFFDTANVYGDGHSESLIGDAFRGMRGRVVIATKAGMERFDALPDYSPVAIRASLEWSLRRLQTDYVDLLQLHNAAPRFLREHPEILDELCNLRQRGLIRSFGLSLKSPGEGSDAILGLGVKILQLNFNMLDMRVRECGLLDLASKSSASLIARTPLCFGFLSGSIGRKTVFPANDHRSRWSPRQLEKWIDAADALFRSFGDPIQAPRTRIALRFCLSFAGVASVIPGMLTATEVRENAGASDSGGLSNAEIAALDAIYPHLGLDLAEQKTA